MDESSFRPAPPGQDSDASLYVKPVNYSAVPRKPSSKDTYESSYSEDVLAPLGFEPEGSATKPNFCEGNEGLLDLLSERNRYSLFREYLRAHKHESLLDFWQSCEEYKHLASTGSNLATSKANSTYRNYMHSNHACATILQDVIRAKIKHKLSSGQRLNDTLFDHAKDVVLTYMREFYYGRFLASNVYNDVSKDRVSARNFPGFAGKGLPPLPEEKLLEENWQRYDGKNPRLLGRVDEERERYVPQKLNLTKAALAGMYGQPAPPVVSVDHSEVQSMSSGALTDDTKSTVTDFSDLTAKSSDKKHRPGFQDVVGFLPRTKKLPKGKKQLPPEEFAKVLIEKLEKVAIEREQEERAAVNLAGLPQEQYRESKKSILEDAAERHHQFQQAGRFALPLPPPKFPESCYPIHANMPQYVQHPGYMERQGVTGYYPTADGASTGWCEREHCLEKRAPLSAKKQWESVGTIESAPDSGISIEEDPSLPQDPRKRILQWMEHSEKEVQQEGNFAENTRTKHCYNTGTGLPHGGMHLRSVAQDPLMPALTQPDSRDTVEDGSRRLSQKTVREKRSKSHKNRTGYMSSKSSQGTCPQFGGDSNECSSSIVPGDYHPASMYNSSSVLSSVPSTVNSKDSGLGGSKNKRSPEGTRIVYYLEGEKYPYQSLLPEKTVVLRHVKELIAVKKGNYRYFFKAKSDDEDCGAVYEEIRDDDEILPCYGGKIICKVKKRV